MALLTRRLGPLQADRLEELPPRCRRCLFWELGSSRPREHDVADERDADPLVRKSAWIRDQELEDGAPGRIAYIEGRPAGWCLFAAPRSFAARAAPVPRPSADALLLATLWVEPDSRGLGLGRLLLQAAVKEAIRRDIRAVEAYGDRRHRDAACVMPSMWLLHEGFEVHREHPRYPLLRLDVRSVARWIEPLEAVVEQALARLGRPQHEPAPAPQRTVVARSSRRA